MAERIDELQLLIGSDASDAIKQLGNLATALDNTASSANNLKNATGQLGKLSSNLSQLSNVNLGNTVDQLKSLSAINLSNLKNNGLSSFTKNLQKLVSTDTSKFNMDAITTVGDVFKDMAKIGSVDSGLKSVVASVAKIASSGDKSQKAADGMKALTPELKNAVDVFAKSNTVDSGVTAFVESLAKLASAGDKAGLTSDHLDDLSATVSRFIESLSKAPAIDSNIATTINGLGNLAMAGQKAGKAMSGAFGSGGGSGSAVARTAVTTTYKSLTSSLKSLFSISVKLGGQGASALGSFLAKLRLIPSAQTGIDRTALSFTNLLRAVLPFFGIKGLFDWGREAFEAGSSIVELENVIDTAFGSLKKGYEDISGYIYKWAQGTIDAFGVSQIAAEKYAGRLMSMFNSSGFDVTEGMRDSAARMSVELIQRAGDIASFYDITVDEALTKIQSGLAGMTRPLRSLGINMSVANMQAYALSQGITTEWQSMDQASQMMLRYSYLMNASQYAAGDFARTSRSAANQVRLLQLNFQQLSATMGQGLVSAIAPILSWLNALIRKLIQAANAFRVFMWTLFGKPIQAAKGVVDDMAGYLDDASDSASGLADGAGGASDGLGKAGKAAKALKKQLTVLPFDELNQLAKDTDSASSGGSGGGSGAGGGVGGLGDMGLGTLSDIIDLSGSQLADGINKWAEKIRRAFMAHDWPGLGQTIAEGINSGIRRIYDVLDWEKVGPKVRSLIQPFQDTVNSLVYNIDWDLLGRTLARGLNVVTKTLRIWINGFHWRDWGVSLATGLNGMLDEWDADAFGRLIADKFVAAWNFFGGFVRTFDFKLLGEKLKEMVNGALTEPNWNDMGDTLAEFLNGINDTILEFFKDDSVITNLSEAFSSFVNSFLEKFDSDKAKEAMDSVKDALLKGLSNAISGINKDELEKDFTTLLSGLPWKTIGLAIGAKAGVDLAVGIFGTAFKLKAISLLTGIGSTASVGGATASVGGMAAAAGGSVTLGTIVGGTLAIGAITIGAIELGQWLKSKGIGQNNLAENKANAADKLIAGQQKNNAQLNAQGINAAGYSTKLMTAPKNTFNPDYSNVTTLVTVEGVVAPSAKEALAEKLELQKGKTATVTVDGKQTSDYKSDQKDFNKWVDKIVTKTATAAKTSVYNSIKSDYNKWVDQAAKKTATAATTSLYTSVHSNYYGWGNQTATKTATAAKAAAFTSVHNGWLGWTNESVRKLATGEKADSYERVRKNWFGLISESILKTVKGTGTDSYWRVSSDYKGLDDKNIKVNVTQSHGWFEDLGAYFTNQWHELIDFRWYAKGGLFNGASVVGVGEAGPEAVVPLSNPNTMRRIANAIVDSGGMNTGSYGPGLAKEIANAIAPLVVDAVTSSANRPVQVNATLYTENDEVLARAVNRGQRSLDKRYNPVSQFTY